MSHQLADERLRFAEEIRDRVAAALEREIDRDTPVSQTDRFLLAPQVILDEIVAECRRAKRLAEERGAILARLETARDKIEAIGRDEVPA